MSDNCDNVQCICGNDMDQIYEDCPKNERSCYLIFWCDYCGRMFTGYDNDKLKEGYWSAPAILSNTKLQEFELFSPKLHK